MEGEEERASIHQQKKEGYTRTHPVLPMCPVVQAQGTSTRVLGVWSFIGCLWTGVHATRRHGTQTTTQKVPDAERFSGRNRIG